MGERILVTGASGFLGGHLCHWLQREGYTVIATGRQTPKNLPAGVIFLAGDLTSPEFCVRVTQNIDTIVHAAAKVGAMGDYETYFLANVTATEALAKAAVSNRVPRFVNISTPSVYFDGQHRRQIKESDPLPAVMHTPYAATKYLAEIALNERQSSTFKVLHLRPRGIFGIGDKLFLGRFLPMIESGKVVLVDGGTSLVDMTYVDNACHAITLALRASDAAYGQVYNISNGEPKSIRDVLLLLAQLRGQPLKLRNIPYPAAWSLAALGESWCKISGRTQEFPLTKYSVGILSRDQTLDISRAKQILGYQPLISLRRGLQHFLEGR